MAWARTSQGALAAEGVNVVLFARTAEKLQAVAREIEQTHRVKVLPVAGVCS
jgi:3-oxoacyl-[acyl-carrier protein] reductase